MNLNKKNKLISALHGHRVLLFWKNCRAPWVKGLLNGNIFTDVCVRIYRESQTPKDTVRNPLETC